jgi:hypothetical protein
MDGPFFVQASQGLLTPTYHVLQTLYGFWLYYSAINPFVMTDAQDARVHYDIGEAGRPSKSR